MTKHYQVRSSLNFRLKVWPDIQNLKKLDVQMSWYLRKGITWLNDDEFIAISDKESYIFNTVSNYFSMFLL